MLDFDMYCGIIRRLHTRIFVWHKMSGLTLLPESHAALQHLFFRDEGSNGRRFFFVATSVHTQQQQQNTLCHHKMCVCVCVCVCVSGNFQTLVWYQDIPQNPTLPLVVY